MIESSEITNDRRTRVFSMLKLEQWTKVFGRHRTVDLPQTTPPVHHSTNEPTLRRDATSHHQLSVSLVPLSSPILWRDVPSQLAVSSSQRRSLIVDLEKGEGGEAECRT